MQKLILITTTILLLSQCNINNQHGTIIHGYIKNCTHDYIVLSHAPRYRGNLNFDSFKSIGSAIDKDGNFKIIAENITHSADYSLSVGGKGITFVLFDGDNIRVHFDLADIDSSLFVTGKGAGKINVLNLPQFNAYITPDLYNGLNDFKSFIDSSTNAQLMILEAIYKKDTSDKVIQDAESQYEIIRIIQESPLSETGYDFLKRKIEISRFQSIQFLSYLCRSGTNDTIAIDFSGRHFESFNKDNYNLIQDINHWEFGQALENILLLEYLRHKQKEYPQLTYNDWKYFWRDSLYLKTNKSFLKSDFDPEIFDQYFSKELALNMTLGEIQEEPYRNFVSQCSNEKYANRLKHFKNLLENGFADTIYNLENKSYELNEEMLDVLLKKHNSKPLYIIFWSAEYAGASIIPYLPSITAFEDKYKNQFEVLNICIDPEKNKNLWAARIIDNDWLANHYFLSKEKNDSIITRFECKNIFSFCDGGATYSWLNTKGEITNNVGSPWVLDKEKIEGFLMK